MAWAAIGTGAASIIGGVASGLIGRQRAPASAAPPKISIADAAAQSTNANSQNFKANAALSKRQNDFNANESKRLLDKAIPGFSGLQAKLLQQVNEDVNSDGRLPTDVSNNLSRIAAEKGISRGTSGGFNDFSLVRDFGFNMVDWKNAQRARSLQTLSSVYGMAPRVNPMTPMSSFVNPGQALGAQQYNETNRYDVEQSNNNAKMAAVNAQRSVWGGIANQAIQFGAGAMIKAGEGARVNNELNSFFAPLDAKSSTMKK